MTRTKPPSNKVLTIRLTEADFQKLETYCSHNQRTKTEVLVEMIRKLKLYSYSKA